MYVPKVFVAVELFFREEVMVGRGWHAVYVSCSSILLVCSWDYSSGDSWHDVDGLLDYDVPRGLGRCSVAPYTPATGSSFLVLALFAATS